MTEREATFPALAPGTRHTRSTTSVTGAINQRTMPGWSQFHRAPAKKREHVHGRVGAKPLRARQGLRISGWVAAGSIPVMVAVIGLAACLSQAKSASRSPQWVRVAVAKEIATFRKVFEANPEHVWYIEYPAKRRPCHGSVRPSCPPTDRGSRRPCNEVQFRPSDASAKPGDPLVRSRRRLASNREVFFALTVSTCRPTVEDPP